jgi:nucleotide-binding universal stress UspA family protein
MNSVQVTASDLVAGRALEPERSRKTSRVLLALSAQRSAPETLRAADEFAQLLSADLHIIRTVAAGEAGPPRDLVQAIRDAQRVLAASRRTRKLCDRTLHYVLPTARICVRLGSLVDQVAQRAAELNSSFIVVPPGTARLAPSVIELARRTDCPVLVPKGRGPYVTLLAATDLEDSRTPLLEQAARLAQELDTVVLAVHSVGDLVGEPTAAFDERRRLLEHAAERLDGRLEPLLCRAADPVQAILEQARNRCAGVIMVGTRPRFGRVPPNTAAQLVQRARRSVLVAPLDPTGGS